MLGIAVSHADTSKRLDYYDFIVMALKDVNLLAPCMYELQVILPGVVFDLIFFTIQVIDRVTQLGWVNLPSERIVDQGDFSLLGS